MDWKEEAAKTIIGGVIIFVGSYFFKLAKRSITPLRKIIKNAQEIERLIISLDRNDRMLDAIIEIHRSPIYFTDKDGGMIYANTAWVELTGFTNVEDAYGMGYMRAVSDEDEQEIMQINQTYYKHPSDLEGIVVFVNLRTKLRIPCKFRSKVVRTDAGEFIMGIGILEIIKN